MDDTISSFGDARCLLLDLPLDLLVHILAQSTGRNTAKAAQTCSMLKKVADIDGLWHQLCEDAGFGACTPPEGKDYAQHSFTSDKLPSCLWREIYSQKAICNHKDKGRCLDWQMGSEASSSFVYLDPGRGAVATGCSCMRCGREFEVIARATYHTDDSHGRCAEEFAPVCTTLKFRARRPSGDEMMDAWDEVRWDDFCFRP